MQENINNENPSPTNNTSDIDFIDAAKIYLDNGLVPIAVTKEKISVVPWKRYQSEKPCIKELQHQFSNPKSYGIAIVCGAISGNLKVIDIDCKYDLTGTLYERLLNLVNDTCPGLIDKLVIVYTVKGGYHWYYRCTKISGGKKLANRYTTDAEKNGNPDDKIRVLIETRAEGNYVVAPPTPGYRRICGEPVNTITEDEDEALMGICSSFDEVLQQPVNYKPANQPKDIYATTSVDDYNNRGNVLELLLKNGWTVVTKKGERVFLCRPGKTKGISADLHEGLNLFKVFSTSTQFREGIGYKPYAVYAILECNGDFSLASKKLAEEGFGQKHSPNFQRIKSSISEIKKTTTDKSEIIKRLAYDERLTEEQAEQNLQVVQDMEGPDLCEFWEVTEKGKIIIIQGRLLNFLSDMGGFYIYRYDKLSTSYQLVQVRNLLVEETSAQKIKEFINDYIYGLPQTFDNGKTPRELLEVILRGADSYFSKTKLEFLKPIELDILKDTKDACYFPFINGIVEITKDAITLKTYQDIGKHIWKLKVISRQKINVIDDLSLSDIVYYNFLDCINNKEYERLQYTFTLIGYLLHKYKDPSKPFAVILAEETDNEDHGGGTGKGIFTTAVQHLTPVVHLDGKNIKVDKGFVWQGVDLGTGIISFDDCRKNIDFEACYSIITEGITVEKKNKDAFFIPFEDSPKLMFSTNYSIPNTGTHAKRRQKILEFSDYFNESHTPYAEFKHQLFNEWNEDEWNRFYHLMFTCVQTYLLEGVLTVKNSETMNRKQIKISYSEEYLQWWQNYSVNGCADWKLLSDLYNQFLSSNDFEKKDYSLKRFRKGLEESCSVFGKAFNKRTNRQSNNKVEVSVVDL